MGPRVWSSGPPNFSSNLRAPFWVKFCIIYRILSKLNSIFITVNCRGPPFQNFLDLLEVKLTLRPMQERNLCSKSLPPTTRFLTRICSQSHWWHTQGPWLITKRVNNLTKAHSQMYLRLIILRHERHIFQVESQYISEYNGRNEKKLTNNHKNTKQNKP